MWFSGQTAGLVGGLLGSGIGILGAVIGICAGIFAKNGKHKRFLSALIVILLFIGIVMFAVGLIALFIKQPYHVWYIFLLPGCICCFASAMLRIGIKKVYINFAKTDKLDNDINKHERV